MEEKVNAPVCTRAEGLIEEGIPLFVNIFIYVTDTVSGTIFFICVAKWSHPSCSTGLTSHHGRWWRRLNQDIPERLWLIVVARG